MEVFVFSLFFSHVLGGDERFLFDVVKCIHFSVIEFEGWQGTSLQKLMH